MSNRAVFLDRDGVIIEDLGYLDYPDLVRILPSVSKAIRRLNEAGYKVVVVSNQSGVARGYFTEDTLIKIHQRIQRLLGSKGAHLDGIYYCPHHPDGTVGKYRLDCECRKPRPGLIFKAAQELALDLHRSFMVGHQERDIEAGKKAGCKTILVTGQGSTVFEADGKVPDFERAVEWILKEGTHG